MSIVHDTVVDYDLLTCEWIPVRPGESVGLRDLFVRAHELEDVVAPLPPAGAGLWRVLTVIAARLTGLDQPVDFEEWESRREAALEAGRFRLDEASYLDLYRERFGLFHPQRPFLQDPRLAEECGKPSGINKLVLSRPAGNNQVWFDHHTDVEARPIPAEEAVWFLLAQLYYGPSGRCTSRTVKGRNEANSTAGPLRGTISFHPLGRTVFESLLVGIPYPGNQPVKEDLAPWERDDLPDPLGLPPAPTGIAGMLTGRFRHAVLLSQTNGLVDNAWITWAWRQPTPTVARDPYLIYQENKTGDLYARGARSERALWRDVDSLLLHDVGEQHSRRPEVMDKAENLPFDVLDALCVRAFGFDQDGQTRDRQWFTATTPAVLSLLKDPQSAIGVSTVRIAAERVGRHLGSALRNAWVAINDPSNGHGPPVRSDIPPGPWRSQGDARYWPRAEQEFWRKVSGHDFDDPAMAFIKAALQVYDEVTEKAGSAPRARRAIERARSYIFAARKPTSSRRTDG